MFTPKVLPALISALTWLTMPPALAQSLTGQVTAVDQLADVSPSHWAYPALQSLAEKHNCRLPGSSRFRGSQPLTRTEFAQQFDRGLTQLQTQIQAIDSSSKTDLETLQKLQVDFQTELTNLNTRITDHETQITTLEKQQFSTTSKLFGQTILGLQARNNNRADLAPRDGRRDTADPATNLTLGYNSQLSLYTQFSPRAIALLGLSAGNLSTAANNRNLPFFLKIKETRSLRLLIPMMTESD